MNETQDNKKISIINSSEEDDLFIINEDAFKSRTDNPFKELDRAFTFINEENQK